MTEASQGMMSIFCEALDRASPEERSAYLDSACGDDLALRDRIDALLQAHERASGFLPEASPNGIDRSTTERPGTVIGPYKLLEQIGEGGFGVVFMAEQQQPVRRMVALKVLKPGMDTRQVVARFEAERQALALMDHANIAQVFDGGETANGRPYFVMELVRGIAITDFCDANHLSVDERLALFISVCGAIQHAHHKGIIHRDLKPANVLVTMHDATPVIKVIDFGIAKAIGQRLTDKTLFTNFAQFFGTPMYMSPEQAQFSGIDVDTRSDVYALGVLLYELLTGTTPFDRERLRTAGYDEIRRIIREEEPIKPSTRLSTLGPAAMTVSVNRHSDPKNLSHSLRGELDWIVMKALDKDRNLRYESASAFAADAQRFLGGEPVLACPTSAGYRIRKFARRNRIALAATTIVAAALLIGSSVAIWQAIVASRAATEEKDAKELALRKEAETRAVLAFVENKILAAARPKGQDGGLGREVALRQAIEAALPFVEKSFQNEPLIEARLRMTLGQSFLELGDAKTAIDQYQRARAIYTGQFGPDHQDTLQSMNRLSNGLEAVGQYAAGRDLRLETLERQQRVLGPEHPDTLATMNNLANSYADLNDQKAAFELREKTLAQQKRILGAEHPETIGSMNSLANSYHALGQYQDALVLRKQTVELYKSHAAFGPKHPKTLQSMHNVANSELALGHYLAAETLFEETLAAKKDLLGANHPDTLLTMNNLANAQHALGRFDEALALREETLKLRRVHPDLGPDHPETLQTMNNLAISYHKFARHEEALKLRLEVLERRTARLGPKHAATLNSMHSLALSYAALNQHDKALAIRTETLALRKAHPDLGPRHADTLRSMHALAASYAAKGEHNEACRLHEEALHLRNETLGKDHPETLMSMKDAATCMIAIGRGEEAVALIDECVVRGAGRDSNLQLLADVLKLRIRHFEKARDAVGCRQTAETWENVNRSNPAGLLLAGRFRAIAAQVVSQDPRTPPTDALRLAQEEADRAMEWLKQAVGAGSEHVGRAVLDKDFAALHDREDFKKLIAEMQGRPDR